MEKRIVIAGGCFWGVEEYYKRLKGINKTTVGYVNGNIKNPTYEDLKNMRATHAEACEIYYNPEVISLEKILIHMFRFIDPFSVNRQGGDIGIQYRTGIYYQDEKDLAVVNKFLQQVEAKYNRKVAVEVELEREYYIAEDYHQDYLTKNPNGYCHVNMDLINADELK